jgi:hypothetical protein
VSCARTCASSATSSRRCASELSLGSNQAESRPLRWRSRNASGRSPPRPRTAGSPMSVTSWRQRLGSGGREGSRACDSRPAPGHHRHTLPGLAAKANSAQADQPSGQSGREDYSVNSATGDFATKPEARVSGGWIRRGLTAHRPRPWHQRATAPPSGHDPNPRVESTNAREGIALISSRTSLRSPGRSGWCPGLGARRRQ